MNTANLFTFLAAQVAVLTKMAIAVALSTTAPHFCPLGAVRCNGSIVEQCSGSLWTPIEDCSATATRCVQHPTRSFYDAAACVGRKAGVR